MIPTIGFMIGAYIFTRMAELLGRSDAGIVVRIFAALTLLISLVGMFILLASGSSIPSSMR